MPRVSVIIPAFNAEAHLAEALRSMLAQTYGDWEAVVGDDGSSDSTNEIAGGFGPRVKVVRNLTSQGPAVARNLAISHSSGELLAFLDSDDYWLPEYLEQQVGLYDARRANNANVGIVACDARVLGPDGFLSETYLAHVEVGSEVNVAHLLARNPLFTSALCPRRVVDEAGGYCEELRTAEDHDLWLRIAELGYEVVVSHTPLAVYRVHGTSLSANPVPLARDTQTVLRRAIERGRLTKHEQRIARRELRRQRAIARIATADGISYRALLGALPLLTVVAVEHPKRWPSFVRVLTSRGRRLSRFGGQLPSG